MRQLGNKVAARNLAIAAGVPVMPATGPLPDDAEAIKRLAAEIGYPVMLKASWGGGGRGMRPVEDESQLIDAVATARREAAAAFGKDEVYLEKLVRRARHVEVQLLGDSHGNLVHLFERDCTIQRRHQKVVERAPAPYLDMAQREELAQAALRIGRATHYVGAGTVEFLMDADSGRFYFIEVNPRIQVEHTVTEVVTGLDIVKAQIRIAEGGRIGRPDETGIPEQAAIGLNGHAMQCRVTTEDPERGFAPDYGRITAYRGASGFGIRVDGGTAYSGAVVTPFYDAMLEKVTAWAPHAGGGHCAHGPGAARISASAASPPTSPSSRTVLAHPDFRAMQLHHALHRRNARTVRLPPAARPRHQAADASIADVTINGHPEMKGRTPAASRSPPARRADLRSAHRAGQQRIGSMSSAPTGFANWMRAQDRVLVTDTTMRDAHQSLLATRMRSLRHDPLARGPMPRPAEPVLARMLGRGDLRRRDALPDRGSLGTAGRDPRERRPNILLQMLLRGANGVGYTNYPDNVVRHFVAQAAQGGVDLFRIFDCLNWVENMRVAIDAVLRGGQDRRRRDLLYRRRARSRSSQIFDLDYYVGPRPASSRRRDAHVLAIKDMAGLLRPAAARALIEALREETDLPIHLHTHDTSGAAGGDDHRGGRGGGRCDRRRGGRDVRDHLAADVSARSWKRCADTPRDTGLDAEAIRQIRFYWEAVRALYRAFESDLRSGASEVYLHEMPGGQFTNLKEQARSLGLEVAGTRWPMPMPPPTGCSAISSR